MYSYFAANRVAGYSGFVAYSYSADTHYNDALASYWMIPGTWEYDWDN